MLFSQRKGISPAQKLAQVDGVDDELRNGLWSALQIYYWDTQVTSGGEMQYSNLKTLFERYWHSFFKLPIDTLPYYFHDALKYVRKYFFDCPWYALYDLIEFTVANDDGLEENKGLQKLL